jgi:hypothetical protein
MVERNIGVKDHPERWQALGSFPFGKLFAVLYVCAVMVVHIV